MGAVANTTVKPGFTQAAVYVDLGNAHGSGVHLGGGYILTAAHVADGESQMTVRDESGRRATAVPVEIDRAHDVALIYAKGFSGVSVDLSCHTPKIGQAIQIVGNPYDTEFMHTWGRVGTGVRKIDDWAEAFVGDITAGPGNSGGPVFDSKGSVVGILVGGYHKINGWAFIVPSSTVCRLMGRS
jgi:S1-C subfamily serine protease